MTIDGGLAGKILWVDLTTGTMREEQTEKYANEFIGGRAINSFLLLKELPGNVTWSDPENVIIFGVGALVGTIAPGACRMSIDTVNVFNNGKGSANVGGHFGAELKFSGFDHVVIKGKSDKPVYLWLHNGKAELRSAEFIWGRTTFETEELLEQKHAPRKIRLATIGPAGENIVKGSAVLVDRGKAAGGCGVGCVMGDKKLKALVACGEGGSIRVARSREFFEAVDVTMKKVADSPFSQGIKKVTPAGGMCDVNRSGWDLLLSVRNGQDDFWESEKRASLTNSVTGFPKYRENIFACPACPVGCMPFSKITEGEYKGVSGPGFWINTIMDAARLDITDAAGMLKAWILCNELGLDTDFTTSVISWAFECYEKDLISEKDTDGLKLEWGNVDSFIKMISKLAYRQGIGDLLAQGSKEAAKKVGGGSDFFAIHVKGQDSIEPFRAAKGWALGVSTSPVGGRHLRGTTLGGDRFGPKSVSFESDTYEDQAKYCVWQSLTKEIEDMLGICSLLGTWSGVYALEPSDYVTLVNSALGLTLTEDDLFRMARRSYNLEKAFNTLHTDFNRKDDYPPRRFIEEPIISGPYKGVCCDKNKWDTMLDEFYELHGWDKETGLQTRTSLHTLGLDNVARKIQAAGKLIQK
jgi:aldehyde:ferredoxin oxidoreductase